MPTFIRNGQERLRPGWSGASYRASWLFLSVLFLFAGGNRVQAQPQVLFDPLHGDFACDDILTVDVRVGADITDLRGFSFVFEFDAAVARPQSVAPGPLMTDSGLDYFFTWINPVEGANTIEIDAGMYEGSLSGPGVILRMQFYGLTNGQCALSAIESRLRDGNNQEIDTDFPAGTFTYSCAGMFFNPPIEVISCDETFAVDVMIDDTFEELAGFSLTFEFDPGVVVLLGAEPGALLTDAGCSNFFTWLNPEPGASTVEIDAGLLGCVNAGPGSILRLKFAGVVSGISPLTCLEDGRVRDSSNHEIPFRCAAAELVYRCAVSGAPTTWDQLNIPKISSLYSNFPNPFNPTTTLKYGIAEAGPVTLRLYDVRGRLVRTLVNEIRRPGNYELIWDGTDGAGREVETGVYLARLKAVDRMHVQRMMLLK